LYCISNNIPNSLFPWCSTIISTLQTMIDVKYITILEKNNDIYILYTGNFKLILMKLYGYDSTEIICLCFISLRCCCLCINCITIWSLKSWATKNNIKLYYCYSMISKCIFNYLQRKHGNLGCKKASQAEF